jgi:hypothetical protein
MTFILSISPIFGSLKEALGEIFSDPMKKCRRRFMSVSACNERAFFS